MNPTQHNNDLGDVLSRRIAYLRLSPSDAAMMRRLEPEVMRVVHDAMAPLYDHIRAHSRVGHLVQDPKRVAHLQQAQIKYYERMMSGEWNEDYLEGLLRIGRAHERVGLDPEYYLGAYAFVFTQAIPNIIDAHPEAPAEALSAFTRIVFFDMIAAIDTYIQRREATQAEMAEAFTGNLSEYLARLEGAIGEIGGATASQAEGAQRQSAAVAEITTAMAELSQTARQALGQAEGVTETTQHTIGIAESGRHAVEQVSSGMEDIRQQMATLSERILLLSEQTRQIEQIIAAVSELSEQSKLLALNASIEAARAGEHGRGFAVVATEMRNLADQSKQSTLQVRGILQDIQAATDAAVLATEQGGRAVSRGADLAQTAGARFHELAQAVVESGEAAKLIASVSRQQGIGIEQIAEAMEEISKNAAASAAGMTTIESGTNALGDLAESVRSLLDRFRTDGSTATTQKAA
jgi:methyl-accepting chemotaxis protein